MTLKLLIVIFAIIITLTTSCTHEGCSDHLDFGSCGNACCKLAMLIDEHPESVLKKMNGTLLSRGPDGQYKASLLAEGMLGFTDLRRYKVGVDFIGQSTHITDNGQYTDTQNWLIYPTTEGGSKLVGFSISQIGGAYGDDGQNYYNLKQIMSTLWPEGKSFHYDKSCQQTS